jgi:hypothetical protein
LTLEVGECVDQLTRLEGAVAPTNEGLWLGSA